MGKREAALVASDLVLLDQSLVKVPVENLKRNLRQAQRATEKEMSHASLAANDLVAKAGSISQLDAVKAIDGLLTRMRGLKRKLIDVNDSNKAAVQSATARVRHLDALQSIDTFSSPEYREWARIRLARQMTDYMLRRGLVQSPAQLAADQNIADLVDTQLFAECGVIEASLVGQSATEALAWCKENQNALKKMNSTVEFDLRFQEYIELVRQGRKADAIIYTRKHLVPWGATHMPQIKQGMALLAFGPETSCPPYRALFDASRWASLRVNFRYTLLSLHSLPPLPMLTLAVHTGLAALKTPACFSPEPTSHNVNCPTCSPALAQLAQNKSVPWSHHANSTIVCKITGQVLEGDDEGREPLALPNGRVYSREALEMLAAEKNGKITCPRTHEIYNFKEVLKVFIT